MQVLFRERVLTVPCALVNDRTGRAVATDVELAFDRRQRRRGLLGRTHLPGSTALMLAPCAGVHTAFMQFTIDVVFLDAGGRVLRVRRGLRPWRLAVCIGSRAVVELAADSRDIEVGDRLFLAPC